MSVREKLCRERNSEERVSQRKRCENERQTNRNIEEGERERERESFWTADFHKAVVFDRIS